MATRNRSSDPHSRSSTAVVSGTCSRKAVYPDYHYDDDDDDATAERPDVYLQAAAGGESPAACDHGTIAAAWNTRPSYRVRAPTHELVAGRAGSLEICAVAVGVCLLPAFLLRVWMMAVAAEDGGARLPRPRRDGFDGRGDSYLSRVGASTGHFVDRGAELAARFGDDVARRRRRSAFLRRIADDAEV
ncbi:hypothetical protein DL764_005246 [Monosporascus ibericus]|uniref:Uncharacterized protein n=1 Tax=Monosporascus ibericus TaxID=155417 RepID=A0A4Q4TDI1_9PEZI|nr:hypothetical protein DL764_005246 [Monosporascus ibericus]